MNSSRDFDDLDPRVCLRDPSMLKLSDALVIDKGYSPRSPPRRVSQSTLKKGYSSNPTGMVKSRLEHTQPKQKTIMNSSRIYN